MAFVELRVAGPTLAPEQVRRLQHEMLDIVSGSLSELRDSVFVPVEPAPTAGGRLADNGRRRLPMSA